MSTKRLCVDTGERRPEGGLGGEDAGFPQAPAQAGARGPQLPPEPGMQGCSAVQGRGVRLGRPPGGAAGPQMRAVWRWPEPAREGLRRPQLLGLGRRGPGR